MTRILFPEIGVSRLWQESYIASRLSNLPGLEWKKLGKLTKNRLNDGLDAPGVYCFVRVSDVEKVVPFESGYPLVVYVGKARKIGARLDDYIKDKRCVKRHRSSERKVRDGVRRMFLEYKDELIVYYSFVDPSLVDTVESVLIQVLDPVFNDVQKLDSVDFDQYNDVVSASIEDSYSAFEDALAEGVSDSDLAGVAKIGKPKPAF